MVIIKFMITLEIYFFKNPTLPMVPRVWLCSTSAVLLRLVSGLL